MLVDNIKLIKRIAIIVAGVFVIIVAVSLLTSWLQNGVIRITTPEGVSIKNVRYCQSSCEVSQASRIQAPKGEYMLQIALSNDTTYTATITVQGQMKETVVQATSQLHNLSQLGVETNQKILPIGESYITYTSSGALKKGSSLLNIPLDNVVTAQYIDDYRIVLVGLLEDSYGQSVLLYDTRTNKVSEVGHSAGILSSNFSSGTDAIYAFNTGSNTAAITRTSDKITTATLPSSVKYTKGNTGYPTFSVNNNLLAIVSSETPDKTGNSIVNPVIEIYSLKDFSKISTIKPRKEGSIYALSLSPDGSNIAVLVDEGYSSVYSTKDASEVFRMSSGGAVAWQNNESFVYVPLADYDGKVYSAGELLLANLKDHSSSSIIDSSLLKSVSISALINNKLYITGYPSSAASQSINQPNGYVVDLSESASSYISPSKEPIVKKLPYRSMTYNIWYSVGSGHIALHTDAYTGYRNLAVRTIHEMGFDPANYTISFDSYVNPFQENVK